VKKISQKEKQKMDEKVTKPDSTKEMLGNLGKTASVVFSFDTTGSMNPCIMQVRQNLRNLVESMTQDIPGLKIGLIAHGDYCDKDNCITVLDLTDDLEKIMNFITNTPNTSGGDAPECYEFVLHTARSLSWPKEGGSLVLIGDDEPHPKEANPNHIDWKEEMKALAELNVKVFPMQCLYNSHRKNVNQFWEGVSAEHETPLLMLESFNDSANVLEAVAYASAGEAGYNAYKGKFAAEVADGVRCRATSNLAENQSKLDDFVKKG
jgi:hypothetical protein